MRYLRSEARVDRRVVMGRSYRAAFIVTAALTLGAAGAFVLAPAGADDKSTVDPEALAAAKEVLAFAGSARQFETIMPLMSRQLEASFLKLQPGHSAEIHEIMSRVIERASGRKQELADNIAVLYAERMTADELRQIVAFYKSPAGTKLLQVQPEIIQQSVAIGQIWGKKIGEEIREEVRKELRNRGIPI